MARSIFDDLDTDGFGEERRPEARQPELTGAQLIALRTYPSQWAERFRVIKDPLTQASTRWSFRHREWQRRLHDDMAPQMVVMKGAQLGVTEVCINRTMHALDMLGVDSMYVFPTVALAEEFSAGRFDRMLELSPRLSDLFSDVRNVGLKRARTSILLIRGANSRTSLKSDPVGQLVLDEFDEMPPRNVPLARERVSGHNPHWELDISTPRFPGHGIDAEYQGTDRHLYHVPCPACGKAQALDFRRNLRLPSEDPAAASFGCAFCRAPWTHAQRMAAIARGDWIASEPGAPVRGYHISQLYSPAQTAATLARAYMPAMRSPLRMEEFYNSKLGLPFSAEGLKITAADVEACSAGMMEETRDHGVIVMGVDIGMVLHVTILEVTTDEPRCLWAGETESFGTLDLLMGRFSVGACVVDAQPERRHATAFRERHPGLVWLAFYPAADQMQGQEVLWNDDKGHVQIHRTAGGDRVAQLVTDHQIRLPLDLPPDYARHLTAVARRIVVDENSGAAKADWVNGGKPDHYFHSLIYALAASLRFHIVEEAGDPVDTAVEEEEDWHLCDTDPIFGGDMTW